MTRTIAYLAGLVAALFMGTLQAQAQMGGGIGAAGLKAAAVELAGRGDGTVEKAGWRRHRHWRSYRYLRRHRLRRHRRYHRRRHARRHYRSGYSYGYGRRGHYGYGYGGRGGYGYGYGYGHRGHYNPSYRTGFTRW